MRYLAVYRFSVEHSWEAARLAELHSANKESGKTRKYLNIGFLILNIVCFPMHHPGESIENEFNRGSSCPLPK